MQNKIIQRAIHVLMKRKYNNGTLHNVSSFGPFKDIFFLNMRLAFYTIILVATSVSRVGKNQSTMGRKVFVVYSQVLL